MNGDLQILARGLTPMEAQMQAAFLQSHGISAQADDVHLVQAHGLIAIAVGGACIRVPQAQLQQAADLLAALARGEFALGDDFDSFNPLDSP